MVLGGGHKVRFINRSKTLHDLGTSNLTGVKVNTYQVLSYEPWTHITLIHEDIRKIYINILYSTVVLV